MICVPLYFGCLIVIDIHLSYEINKSLLLNLTEVDNLFFKLIEKELII